MRRILPAVGFCRSRSWRRWRLTGVVCCLALLLLVVLVQMRVLSSWICAAQSNVVNHRMIPVARESKEEQIDIVYTWVNGSEERFLADLRRYSQPDGLHHVQQHHHLDPARFDDKNELLFSLRSLQAHASAWIRNVHIITNGQLPHWLDLDNPRVHIHTHADLVRRDALAEEQMLLPTFSSAAIETLLHLVPDLTDQFLYLNDDVFVGREAFYSDLWTHGGGTRVFRAWPLPDCAVDCPWTYVADGACDPACNCEECQWDGGDCRDGPGTGTSTEMVTEELLVMPQHLAASNLTDQTDIRKHVASFNAAQKLRLKQLRRSRKHQPKPQTRNQPPPPTSSSSPASTSSAPIDLYAASLLHTQRRLNVHHGHRSRRVIGHVGFLLDRHVLHDFHRQFAQEIAETRANRFRSASDLQFAFAYFHHLMEAEDARGTGSIFDEFDTDRSGSWSDREIRTLLTRISPLPLDWATVRYFEEIVANCSTSQKGGRNGGARMAKREDGEVGVGVTNDYERYIDSSIPHVSKELVVSCHPLVDILRQHFGRRRRFRHTVDAQATATKSAAGAHVNSHFKMLTSNVTQVIEALDQLRQMPRLFVCINDNRQLPSAKGPAPFLQQQPPHHRPDATSGDSLDEELADANALIVALLEDFYVSLFPLRSPFELADGLRNRFATVHEWRRWRRQRSRNENWLLGAGLTVIVALVIVRSIFALVSSAWWKFGGRKRRMAKTTKSKNRSVRAKRRRRLGRLGEDDEEANFKYDEEGDDDDDEDDDEEEADDYEDVESMRR